VDPRAELERALALENETERKLAVAALINRLVRPAGWRAIVIGGLAVEFWTDGAYTTSDVDLYLPRVPAVDDVFARMGFAKEGRHWILREHELFVEAPAASPADAEEVTEVELSSGDVVLVLSIEDVIIDRLHQFVSGGHRDVAEQGMTLLLSDELDRGRLVDRARGEGLSGALVELEGLVQLARSGERIESHELHEIARRLQREP
jgi:hypothetical protein